MATLFENPMVSCSLTQLSQQMVVCHPEEPRRRVVRKAGARPRLEGCHESELNGILDELNLMHADPARQSRNQSTVFVPEKVVDEL